ncbi:hypothetical protein [Mucilaginibacter sp.]|jgi:hypothetical protein|uniref:hypothetical protein n=1 Tax=Mucilaginibacter sp. TaxID=1882438 RepID=UPI0035635B1F
MATVDNSLNLLVPIHLEAMVVNNNNTYWKNTSLDLTKLAVNRYPINGALGYYLERNINDIPVKDDDATILDTGVHLHWVMPDALRKGKHAADGTFDFPAVPNRWLVLRTNEAGEFKSWVVQSDCLNTSASAKYNYIKEDGRDNSLKPIKLGKDKELQGWEEDLSKKAIDKLTIMAPGNPEFAASYLNCKGVFGYHDKMLDENGNFPENGAEFSYQVYGWYADKENQDPLRGVTNLFMLNARLKELAWALDDVSALKGEVTGSTVCYAMVNTVIWKTPESRIPDTGIKVGIGNTASEALASLLTGETKTISSNIPEKLLAAYQFKSLSDNGVESNGLDILLKKVHAKTFLPVEAGVQWVVQPPERKAGDNSKETNDKSLEPFDPAVSNNLQVLNRLQDEYNRMADELASQQAELYALKFKLVFSGTSESDERSYEPVKWTAIKEKITADISGTKAVINKLMETLVSYLGIAAGKKGKVNDAVWPVDYTGSITTQYNKLLKSIEAAGMKDFEVKKIAAPHYYEPVDPAIVITGLDRSESTIKRSLGNLKAENDAKNALKCRTRRLLANKLLLTNNQFISAGDIFSAAVSTLFSRLDAKKIPAGIKDLISESLLLNPLMARQIIDVSKSGIKIKDLKQLITKYSVNAAKYKHTDGADLPAWLPPAAAVSSWQQPWKPLYLEWAINWQNIQRPGREALLDWKFGDAKNRIDFKYKGSLKNYKGGDNATAYYGRTLLSSQFSDKVKSLNATIKNLFHEDLFNEFRPMAQSLGGFTTQLIQRYNGVQLPIVDIEAEKLKVNSDYRLMGNQNSWRPMIVNQPFIPLRCGLMQVTMLRVIDAFGQALNVWPPNKLRGLKNQVFKNSAGLRRGGDINKFELEPRIIQPSRLRFDWVSANDATRVTDSDPATSPVCGWLLYNDLDKNIVMYEQSGVEVGYFVKRDNETKVRFIEPTKSHPISDTLCKIKDFIKSNPNNFKGICTQIDLVTKRIQAKYSRQQLTMALPTGFPMAIVSAQFLIELKGRAAHDQSWLGGEQSLKFEPINYDITVGNAASKTDGLVGYFLNGNYSSFMVPAGEKNVPIKFKNSTGQKFLIGETQKLTILMDPRTMITITSGLLPMGNYEMPQHAISKALKNINIRILAAPILTPVGKLKMPLLKSNDVNWDFISPLKTQLPLVAEEATSPLTYEEIQASEGWLTLVNKNPDSN